MTGTTEWQLVPKEPTAGMLDAASEADDAAYVGGSQHGLGIEALWEVMLSAAPEPPHLTMTKEEAATYQDWKGMDGACAFHLIERHANGWGDVAQWMEAWLAANVGRNAPNN